MGIYCWEQFCPPRQRWSVGPMHPLPILISESACILLGGQTQTHLTRGCGEQQGDRSAPAELQAPRSAGVQEGFLAPVFSPSRMFLTASSHSIPPHPTYEVLVKEQGTLGLTTPSPGSEEITLNNSAFAFSIGFATGSHESLQISQHSLTLAACLAPKRRGLWTVLFLHAKKMQINRQTSYFLMYPSLMVINRMSAIFSICFKLFSIVVLPEMGVYSA